jgi:hypothetical protein
MERENGLLAVFTQKINEYLDTNIELIKLKLADKSASMLSEMATMIAILLALTLAMGIVSVGLALLLGSMLGRLYYGFFLLGGLFGLVVFLAWIFRDRWIRTPLGNIILKKMLS